VSDNRMIQNYVPVIGRPNVGKSTLFNRLVGEDRAITGEEAGVTRDRLSTDCEWDGRGLTLVDTAGYQPDHPSPDPSFVIDQVQEMIDGAQVILFVVDAGEGLTPLDRSIAEELYPHADRVIVVVNKVDPGRVAEEYVSDFYELGFETVVPASGLHDRNTRGVQKAVLNKLPEQDPDPPVDGIRLSLVGRPNVGKSTMFNQIIGYDRTMVSEEPGTTRDVVDISFEVDDQRYYLVDTAGLRKKSQVEETVEKAGVSQSIKAINFSDVVCLMVDWNERVTNQDQRIAGLVHDSYRGCMILVNKADEPDEDLEDNWLMHVRKRLYFLNFAPILFTSGRNGRGLGGIFQTAREIHREMNRWIPEDELANTFLDLKPNISWPSKDARDVVLQRIRQVDVNPVTFEIEATEPGHLTKQDHRHLKHLLQKHVEIHLSPIKLKIVEDFEE
jgi:GTP-binding protein